MDIALIQTVEARYKRSGHVPDFRPGDLVRVITKYQEGDKERQQSFEGVVLRRRGEGTNETFTVRRVAAHNVSVERTFFLHSPNIVRVEILRRQRVRRARLYYLRERKGKAARLREDRARAEADRQRAKEAPQEAERVEPTTVESTAEHAMDVEAQASSEE